MNEVLLLDLALIDRQVVVHGPKVLCPYFDHAQIEAVVLDLGLRLLSRISEELPKFTAAETATVNRQRTARSCLHRAVSNLRTCGRDERRRPAARPPHPQPNTSHAQEQTTPALAGVHGRAAFAAHSKCAELLPRLRGIEGAHCATHFAEGTAEEQGKLGQPQRVRKDVRVDLRSWRGA